ncbi:MAG TPA: hypothetical protein V6D00_15245 [Pantanalinema sp.]
MHPRQIAVVLWIFTVLVALGIVAHAWYRERLQATPRAATPRALAWACAAVLAGMGVAAFAVAPTPLKGWHALGGLLVGGGLGLAWAYAPLLAGAGDATRDTLLRFSIALVPFVLADVGVSDPVLLSYALFGGVLGLAATVLIQSLDQAPRAAELALALALVGALAAAMVWGDRAAPQHSIGTSRALAWAALALGCRYATLSLPGAWGAPAGGLLLAGLALPAGLWGLRLDPRFLWAALAGVVAALVLGAMARMAARAEAARAIAALGVALVAGGALLLCNRFFGIHGVAIAGVGAGLFLADRGLAFSAAGLLASSFAGRALLQLFLDRTYLRQVGVDLTHPYTALGLAAALLVPFALQALCRHFSLKGILLGIAAFLTLSLPLGMGYFVHIEPLATYVMGLVLLGLTFALARPESGTPQLGILLPPVLLGASALSLLSAPWLISVMNTPRPMRAAVFAALSIVLFGYGLALVRRRLDPTVAT